jgi:uncharacterized coiled-coil protein SlyX
MKRPIKWYEECLAHWERRNAEEEEQLQRLAKSLAKSRQDAERLRSQIARAKRLGKDGFDEERFQPEKGGE